MYEKKQGFDKYFEFHFEHCNAPIDQLDVETLISELEDYKAIKKKPKIQILDVPDVDIDKFIEFNEKLIKFDRQAYLKCSLARPVYIIKAAFSASTSEVVGYASLRTGFQKFLTFSQILANRSEIAFALMLDSILAVPDLNSFGAISPTFPSTNNAILTFAK
ncbi:hypothetical protein L596_022837 [Steinernema carpocapsae]|uniref:YitH acetyltransferase (GNAT) domain-containing protein n=1 Tax=Steinernema carpocapsae TaxID=34508 RepID=A0A4U5MMY0_STECR|nr:hypothetical protein L596_022837 [Steinernema carpocapsae]